MADELSDAFEAWTSETSELNAQLQDAWRELIQLQAMTLSQKLSRREQAVLYLTGVLMSGGNRSAAIGFYGADSEIRKRTVDIAMAWADEIFEQCENCVQLGVPMPGQETTEGGGDVSPKA